MRVRGPATWRWIQQVQQGAPTGLPTKVPPPPPLLLPPSNPPPPPLTPGECRASKMLQHLPVALPYPGKAQRCWDTTGCSRGASRPGERVGLAKRCHSHMPGGTALSRERAELAGPAAHTWGCPVEASAELATLRYPHAGIGSGVLLCTHRRPGLPHLVRVQNTRSTAVRVNQATSPGERAELGRSAEWPYHDSALTMDN